MEMKLSLNYFLRTRTKLQSQGLAFFLKDKKRIKRKSNDSNTIEKPAGEINDL